MSSNHRSGRGWIAVGAVVLLGAHVVALHLITSRFALPIAATIGLALLLVATHSGSFVCMRDRVKRRP